jgi:GNAT superfamily N-acetyltransferase
VSGGRAGGVTRTHLELTDARALRPAPAPRVGGVVVERHQPPDGALNRWLYERVGRDYAWVDLLGRTDADWQAWAERVETWVATVAGERAGYYELDPQGDSVEIAHLGLLPAFHGLGLGGHLLTHALRRGLERAGRVWVHTCTTDAPAALPNYRARGLVAFRVEAL